MHTIYIAKPIYVVKYIQVHYIPCIVLTLPLWTHLFAPLKQAFRGCQLTTDQQLNVTVHVWHFSQPRTFYSEVIKQMSMCHKIRIFTLTLGFYTLGRGGGRPFSNAHNLHSKIYIYNELHSGALQNFNNILQLSIYKWFNIN